MAHSSNSKTLNSRRFVQVPLSLEQIAFSLRQLSKKDLEILDLILDKNFEKVILTRGKTAWQEYRKGRTIPLKKLQKEFS